MRRSSQPGAKASLVLELVNTGNKDATNVNLSLTAESEYFLDCEQYTVERIPTPVEGSTTRILVKLGTIWAGKDKTVRCSATETPVLNRVTIYLGVEADQQLGGQQFPSPITIINNRRLNLQRQPGP
jgi:Ni,Fe-hydrogenase III small subunit